VCKRWIVILLGLFLLAWVFKPQTASAESWREPSASELINEVNNLRIANGLAPLSTHPILMQTAQSQADALLATEGAIGHGRPNGMTFTQQLLLLAYPLSGDLSQGGYRSENFVFGYQMSPKDAIGYWQGDEPHTNTMLSPNRSDIGAGVAIGSDGAVYYVIDTALQTASGQPQEEAKLYLPGGSGSALNPEDALNQYIVPITVAAARPDGDVYHKVQFGQTLWGLAIAYNTKIDEIRRLNNLGTDNTVYPNQVLLIMHGATPPPPATVIAAPKATINPADVVLPPPGVAPTWTPSPTPIAAERIPEAAGGPSLGVIVLVLALLIVVGGGTAAWFIREPVKE
jgi:uncharacterized protein YkwD